QLQQAIFGRGRGFLDLDQPPTVEHPGHTALVAEVSPTVREGVTDLLTGAVAVVGQRLDQDGHTTGGISLVHHLVVAGTATLGPGAPLDGPLDVVQRNGAL